MKDLRKLYIEVLEDVMNSGIEVGNITDVTVSYRAKRRFGQCCYRRADGTYTINISSFILADGTETQAVKNTIAHEIIHTVKGCMNHGPEWKKQAAILMKYHTEYKITRTSSIEEYGIEAAQKTEDEYRYLYKCTSCGRLVGRNRESNFTRNVSRYRCGACHGKFVTIRRPDDRQLLVAAMRYPS